MVGRVINTYGLHTGPSADGRSQSAGGRTSELAMHCSEMFYDAVSHQMLHVLRSVVYN